MPRNSTISDATAVTVGWAGALVSAAVLVIPMAVLGPAELYSQNTDEFATSLGTIYTRLLPVGTLFLVALTFIFRVLPAPANSRVIGLGLALGAALYVQAHLLTWDYGQFDGTGIDWDTHQWHGMVDAVVWIGFATVGVLARRPLARNVVVLGCTLLAIQVVSAAVALHSSDVTWRERGNKTIDDGIFKLSSNRNALVIVLDAFATPIFEQVIERQPSLVDEFTGFTFFRNAISVLPTTRMSIPAILTGVTYHNEQLASEYLDTVFTQHSVVLILDEQGYRTDLITLGRFCKRIESDSCWTPGEVVATDRNALGDEEAIRLSDLVLFRYLPQAAKRHIYGNEHMLLANWLESDKLGIKWHLSEALGVADLLSKRLHVSQLAGSFKFIHLMVPHHPYHLDRECRPLPRGERGTKAGGPLFLEQAECAVQLTIRILRKLKSLEIYDQSAIIVVADHGFAPRELYESADSFARRGTNRALPLLLVKPPGARGAMNTSLAPATNADVAQTVAGLLNLNAELPGYNLMALDEDTLRTRRYYHYVWRSEAWGDDYLPPIQEYILDGDPRDPSAWREGRRHLPKNSQSNNSWDVE